MVTDEELTRSIDEHVEAAVLRLKDTIGSTVRAALKEEMKAVGIDTSTADGYRNFHEGLSLLRTLVMVRNKIGNTVIVWLTMAGLGWLGYKLWGGAK